MVWDSERALNHKKTRESQNFSFARIFTRILPGFFIKIRLDSAQIFTKMSPVEELVTLIMLDAHASSGGEWADSKIEFNLIELYVKQN